MGRWKNWDAEENDVLARAWIAASEDPITGTDQTCKVFQDTIRCHFIEKGPKRQLGLENKYEYQGAASIKKNFSDMPSDVQKFLVSLGKVRACNPTGVDDDVLVSMAVAIHLEHTKRMEYDYKNFKKDK
ncbi:hypothetical protein BWQ96_10367 [Gracilariopsis chorda]|uniref:Myb/SANT-like domain-containing protein n=1 Tax=Gracilariopsis chorda TaxID=448386 RepID=A0A2V3ICW0_9FLOR|nr:hypothetical protein BWQ96_10367 [Gracilariopsis chorda]|eukprot:PXF39923.1 hypothetical protein BWQ96_10367 [Gracilariopsis chorda]